MADQQMPDQPGRMKRVKLRTPSSSPYQTRNLVPGLESESESEGQEPTGPKPEATEQERASGEVRRQKRPGTHKPES
jgi:hypothetical protein